jgi:hypothetical protein
MSAVICFPVDGQSYSFAKIYRANSLLGEYTLLNTVSARQREYEDPDGNAFNYYKVAFSNGTDDTEQIYVKSLIQQVIDVIRNELKITASILANEDIDFLFEKAKEELILDICKYYYGVQISKVAATIYKLPNRYFFDHNCVVEISCLDFGFFKQATPLYIYSEKIPVIPVYVDPVEQYVELSEPLASNEILKVNYYSMGRKISHKILVQLLAYKTCTLHYDFASNNSDLMTSGSKIRIGDITIQSGTSTTSSSSIKDTATKMNAKYNNLLVKVKSGFFRMN